MEDMVLNQGKEESALSGHLSTQGLKNLNTHRWSKKKQERGRSHKHFRRGRNGYLRSQDFSSLTKKEDLTFEEEAERKIGWMLKLFFAGTATYVGYQFFPYMGFYRGIAPGVTGSLATGATYFGVIESTKKWIEESHTNLGGHWVHFIAGAIGMVSTLLSRSSDQ
ncbi:unnamed protein product [Brassica napus]|uniref:(rape) hypothetical protein n=1 Tax=Brassica napus TaxID=3708 RepID=A0A816QCC6_BRANA|nr:unnamed protein product [Brassica napus]